MKKVFYFLGAILSILAIYVSFFSPSTTILSPLGNGSNVPQKTANNNKYVILGFAPYWNIKKISETSLEPITHYAYFHLLLNGDGTIYTKVNKKSEDPGYTNYKRLISGEISYNHKPLILTFMPESQEALTSMISTELGRKNTIATIVSTISDSGATGVNIDFEPLGDIPPSTRSNFTLFIQELRLSAPKPNLITISVYASAAARPRLWDLSELSKSSDYFVIMTYDYTLPGSNSAGPNAPLRGSGDLFEHDIIKNIAEITKVVPSNQVLMGIPFYGYEWDTVDASKYSPADSKGSVASLERIQKMIDDKSLELIWDRNSLTPYGVSSESGKISQIYFENETSIRLKLEFVKSANLGGIAIWALGYEGNTPWIWPTIKSLNH